MQLLFFEDELAEKFAPLALTRPVFELMSGACSIRERVTRYFGVSTWGAALRPHLGDVYLEQNLGQVTLKLDQLTPGPVLCLNGRFLPDLEWLRTLEHGQLGCIGERVVAISLSHDELQEFREASSGEFLKDYLTRREAVPAQGRLLEYPWQLIEWNAELLVEDFPLLFGIGDLPSAVELADLSGQKLTILGDVRQVRIDETAQIDPFVMLDARSGPIVIEKNAKLQAFTRIEGPCYIGTESRLFGANVRAGTTIGPHCRVGGEIEGSILHGYVNKYHDGFLGHSYVCPWVNLGAMTTNSDLKNNYSTIKFRLDGEFVETQNHKLGSLIGDHCKTAIGTMLNTGTSLGLMSMALPADRLPPRFIPSFAHWWDGELREARDIGELIETARIVKSRRGQEMTKAEESLYRLLFQRTKMLRETAVKSSRRA